MTPSRRLSARPPKDQPMHTFTPDALTSLGSSGGLRRRPLASRAAGALAALATVATAALTLTAAPALADDCPNAALRAQNNSAQLPDCRAYEQVSPEFKEGFVAVPTGFTDDGRLSYDSNGNFSDNGWGFGSGAGGNAYLATRTGSGWSSIARAPHGPDFALSNSLGPSQEGPANTRALSRDLRSTLWNMRRGDQPSTVQDLYVRDPDGVFTRLGSAPDQPGVEVGGFPTTSASADLSHVVFSVKSGETYEFVRAEGDQRRAVSVDNAGLPLVGPGCAETRVGGYHAVSADGRVIVWTCSNGVYARVNETTTIAVSASQCTRSPSDPGGACNANSTPSFQGANADGTRVYFTTSQQLVNGDTDGTRDLYECDIPVGTPAPVGSVNTCPDLREVSGAASGANVQSDTRISDDGSRAYFVATGVLAANPGANDAPAVAGDDNLYVWTRNVAHPGGETRFVAKLDPADHDTTDPANTGMTQMRQTTDDGRYLVFVTHAQLIDHGPQVDTDTASDVYRYDAETGALVRLSTDADGQGGNQPAANAIFDPIEYGPNQLSWPGPRGAMSDDGASAVFTTDDALAPADTNGTVDSYLWHDGRVSLISSGKPSSDQNFTEINPSGFGSVGVTEVMISPSGRDVYFTTTAQLLSSDVDTVADVYDARVGGGFDRSTPPACSGDGCQGPPSAPPPGSPGSTSSTGQDGSPQPTPAFTLGKLTASQLKRIVSTGKVSLSVTTNAPGTLTATATIAKRPGTVGSAKRKVTKAGTVSLSLTLSKKARAELKSTRRLTVKVLVRQDSVAIARTVSLKLTQPKPAKKTKKKSSRTTSRHAAAKGGRS